MSRPTEPAVTATTAPDEAPVIDPPPASAPPPPEAPPPVEDVVPEDAGGLEAPDADTHGANEVGGDTQGANEPDGDPLDEDPVVAALMRYASLDAKAVERARRIHARLESARPLHELLVESGAVSEGDVARAQRLRRGRMSILDILEEDEVIGDEERATYEEAQAARPRPSDRDILVGGGLVREEQYLKAVGAKLDIPFVEPQIGAIDTELYTKVPFAYLVNHHVLPIAVQDGVLDVIVANPEDEALIVEVERTFGTRVRRLSSTKAKITEALRTLERLRGRPSDQHKFKVQYRVLDRVESNAPVTEHGQEAIQLVDYLLTRAIELHASDLHIEPSLNRIRVRVRVDGVLHHLTDLPIDFGPRVTARIKIIAGLDVTEKRLHQDGKIHVRVGGGEVDIRVSTYVSTFGETIVMRLLDREKGIVPVDALGFQPKAFQHLTENVLRASSGLVLVVGPTGSGKTTTLYSFVDHANDPTRKVITCEDPVEYVIEGIVQCSVNAKTGPTFADSLRSIVRQDPDTIVVGEIRDKETASLAVEAALTGHKVYSTYHTEEAAGAFVRLLEMGIEPFLVGSTVSAVIAQRLVRRLCEGCKARQRPTQGELRFLKLTREELGDRRFMGPRECSDCNGTGYSGRIAVHEVLVPDDPFRQAVMDRTSSDELREIARGLPGFLTMMEDGITKASRGLTSISEIIESVPRDPAARPLAEIERVIRNRRS